jgi:site-specific recombinase XerD
MSTSEVTFPALLQDFFLQRLVAQRSASAHTVASYRDAFELLLRFAEQRTRRTASSLKLSDLDAPLILDFLDHLEQERGNSPRTRNARLAAIRSFMRYASVRVPSALPLAQRVLAIPAKRFDRPVVGSLSRDEVEALLDAPDRNTWSGRRDVVLLAVLYNTGARVSEITGLCVADLLLDRDVAVRLHGKGRKERVVPLWKSTSRHLRDWLAQIDRHPSAPVFPNRAGKRLSRSGVEYRLRIAVGRR